MKSWLVCCVVAFWALIVVPECAAQVPEERIPRIYYAGTMVGEGSVVLMLTEALPGQLFGYFYSDSLAGQTDLRGRLGAGRSFELRTSVDGKTQERLSGYFSPEYDVITGTFADSVRSFRLDRIAVVRKDMESTPYGSGDFFCIRTVEYPVFDSENESMGIDWYPSIAQYLNLMVADIAARTDDFCEPYLMDELDLLSADMESLLSLGDITFFSSKVVSLLFYEEAYEGGAHWNMQTVAVNLRFFPEPDVLALKDCFKPGMDYLGMLSGLCIEELIEQGAPDIVTGSITDLRDKLDTFVITPDGFLFVFDPYRVGSYADGQFFVTIPFDVVQDMIDRNGPLGNIAAPR